MKKGLRYCDIETRKEFRRVRINSKGGSTFAEVKDSKRIMEVK